MSEPYHKIQTVFKRTQKDELILWDWTEPYFQYLRDNTWRCTEKIDGTNIRVAIQPVQETVGQDNRILLRMNFDGRTDNANLPARLVYWLMEKFGAPEMRETLLAKFPDGVTLYGEGFGAGIQKGGGKYQPHQSYILFDVRIGQWWLQWKDVVDVAQTLGLPHVPVVGHYTLDEMVEVVRGGLASSFGDFPAEGIVAVPNVDLYARDGSRIITKLKTRDFEKAVEKE